MIVAGTVRVLIRPGIPMTKKVLNTFEPMMFPTAISGFPARTAETVTKTSGRLVPRATALRAITSVPTPTASDIAITASITNFAPRKMKTGLSMRESQCFQFALKRINEIESQAPEKNQRLDEGKRPVHQHKGKEESRAQQIRDVDLHQIIDDGEFLTNDCSQPQNQ